MVIPKMTVENFKGIIGIDYAFPKYYVSHDELANYLHVDPEKFCKGLNLFEMSVPSDRDDPVSLALTAVDRLMRKYNIDPDTVGRIDVGSESNFDSSKSIKTYLMDLFPNNKNILGADNVNACYGGTSALLNAFCYMDSTYWDGRYCIVVCTDISRYNDPAAIPTSGAGAVAMLLGSNPVFVLERNMFHYFANEFDFFKPVENFPYPIVDGKLSISIYKKSFETLFEMVDTDFDYLCMHTPYPKLPLKAIMDCGIDTYKLESSLWLARHNGNSYTASLYFCLISLIYKEVGMKVGDKVLMFSYGSGVASSIFVLRKVEDRTIVDDVETRLNAREKLDPRRYMDSVLTKQNIKDFDPIDKSNDKGAFYLDIISGYKRFYKRNN